MCGIAGYVSLTGASITDSASMIGMLQVQKHRGPDDGGIRAFSWSGKTAEVSQSAPQAFGDTFDGVLGFNRLSILDLSHNGHQPMCNLAGDVIFMLNGEIYNAFDFRDSLIADGYSFRSTTDTEVALNLYLKYGFEKMLSMLNGMFAIVVVDLRHSEMFVARDRFGIKPVYIFENGKNLAFASEIKSFLNLPGFNARLDESLIDEYLLFRNNINQSLFTGVRNLEPGTYLHYRKDGGVQVKRYFDVNDYVRTGGDKSLEASQSFLKSQIREAVQRQLLSDVKLGCQLSGGIDSSLVTYYAKDIKRDDLLETISIILEDRHFSEEAYMDHVAQKVQLKAHKFQLNAKYYLAAFEKATWQFEAPLNHPNTIGIYLLSEEAKKYVTVLLSGEGADEVFGGYGRFAAVQHPWSMTWMPGTVKRNRSDLSYLTKHFSSPAFRTIMGSAFLPPVMGRLLKTNFNHKSAIEKREQIYHKLTGSLFDKHSKYEIKTYLPDLLMRQDKMSMAHSIENRVPFLDNKVVDASFAIPEKHLVPDADPSKTKLALKNIAAEIFGSDFAFRRKQGFGIPLKMFFKDREFNSYLHDAILPSLKNRGLFSAQTVQRWMNNLDNLSVQELEALWIMVAFETWAKKFNISGS